MQMYGRRQKNKVLRKVLNIFINSENINYNVGFTDNTSLAYFRYWDSKEYYYYL